jgi:hypothetical protein
VAVDAFLAQASLSSASRRVYRISLTSLAWPLVGKRPPEGRRRCGAAAPVLPLALFDRPDGWSRRAAEIFAECTRPLDPAGRGWTLRQLRQSARRPRSGSLDQLRH